MGFSLLELLNKESSETRLFLEAHICVSGHVSVDPIKHSIVGGDSRIQNYLTLDSLTGCNKTHPIITAGDMWISHTLTRAHALKR